jgi:puromycin-sensitive aminopeptidase
MPEHLNPFRLPTHVVPSAYRIRLEPDLEAARFDGTVEIDVRIAEATNDVALNAVDLEFGVVQIRAAGGESRTGQVTLDAEHERATLHVVDELEAGDYVVSIAFAGTLNDNLVGFYRSTYTDAEGADHTIATTQFESTDARRAFPCFDEPAFKATYASPSWCRPDLAAFSNSPVDLETPLGDGRREVVFAPR